MNLKENFYIEKAYPTAVRKKRRVINAESLIMGEGLLTLKSGGYVVYDMGNQSVGGYPSFTVKSFKGTPTLRIAYSDRIYPFNSKKTMIYGDFVRNSCDYLGVELPVMPANPYRFEEYEIKKKGKFTYPLVQGQERFVLIYLSEEKNTETDEVCISSFYVSDNSAKMCPKGYFESDVELLNRLWLASAKTIRLATVKSFQWENVGGALALRKLTFSEEGAVFKGINCKSIELAAKVEIYLNPEYESGVGFLIFSDGKNGYAFNITSDGKTALTFNGEVICETDLGKSVANEILKVNVSANEKGISVRVNGKTAAEIKGGVDTRGSFGFYMQSEWRAVLSSVNAVCDGKEISNAFNPDAYGIKSVDYFVSDGAKRDRLPWTGDLFWAFDGAWYAFGDGFDPAATLDILAFHQNPEGFIFGTCYPENDVKPASKNYGYYQSDAFSVWFVVSALYYYSLSGDEKVGKYFETMRRCMDYAWRYVDMADNLFIQRYETSKGLWDHDLGDGGKITYTNMLICDAFCSLSDLSRELGENGYAAECASRHKKMRKAILKHLYDKKAEGFVKKKGSSEICDLSNPYAMARGFVNGKTAAAISHNAQDKSRAYGKIITLMIRGLYDYGYGEIAEKLLFGKTPYYKNGELYSIVDWVGAIGNPDLPETVYECMHNPPYDFGANLNWGDLSHPDSAINGILSAYVAGIKNIGKGFDKILVKPFPYKYKKMRCGVPAGRGLIEIKTDLSEKGSAVSVSVPYGTKIKTDFSALPKPVKFSVKYNATDKEKKV